jgi:uncharacterized protein
LEADQNCSSSGDADLGDVRAVVDVDGERAADGSVVVALGDGELAPAVQLLARDQIDGQITRRQARVGVDLSSRGTCLSERPTKRPAVAARYSQGLRVVETHRFMCGLRYTLLCMSAVSASELVVALRERAGVTQTELARRAGMAQSAISDYERGLKEPSLSTLQRLAAALDLAAEVRFVPSPAARTLTSLRRKRRRILEICKRHGASNPRVFGSTATGSARADSDIDLVVDLDPGRTLFDIAGLHDDLVDLLGREVDILTPGALRGRLAHVASEAVPL